MIVSFFDLFTVCENPEILKAIYFVNELLKVVCFLVPIGLIVMLTVDFTKIVIAGDENAMQKNFHLAIKRVIMSVGLFLVPQIVFFSMTMLENMNVDFALCITNATVDRIQGLEADMAESLSGVNFDSVEEPYFGNNSSSASGNTSSESGNGSSGSGNGSSGSGNGSSGSGNGSSGNKSNKNLGKGPASLPTLDGVQASTGKCNKKGNYPSGNIRLKSTGKKNSAGFLIKQMDGDTEGVQIVNYALRYIGYPYVLWGKGDLLKTNEDYKKVEERAQKWGHTVQNYGIKKLIGKDDIRAFDCSGFVYYVFKQFGYFSEKRYQDLSSSAVTTYGLAKIGKLIGSGDDALKKAKIGDIILYGEPGKSNSAHVSIYMGNNTIIHQTAGSPICGVRGVTVTSNFSRKVFQVRRIIGIGTAVSKS